MSLFESPPWFRDRAQYLAGFEERLKRELKEKRGVRSGLPWSDEEDEYLLDLGPVTDVDDLRRIAKILGRSASSVDVRLRGLIAGMRAADRKSGRGFAPAWTEDVLHPLDRLRRGILWTEKNSYITFVLREATGDASERLLHVIVTLVGPHSASWMASAVEIGVARDRPPTIGDVFADHAHKVIAEDVTLADAIRAAEAFAARWRTGTPLEEPCSCKEVR